MALKTFSASLRCFILMIDCPEFVIFSLPSIKCSAAAISWTALDLPFLLYLSTPEILHAPVRPRHLYPIPVPVVGP